MKDTQWGKLAAVVGVLFVITLVVGFIFAAGDWEASDSDQSILDYFNDGSNQTGALFGGFLMTFAGVAFIWFIVAVRGRLVANGPVRGDLDTVAVAAGVAFAALILVTLAFWVGPAGGAKFGDTEIPKDADILRQLQGVGFPILLLGGAWAAALCIGAVSWCILTTGGFARWLGWLGLVCAVLLLFSVLFFPIVALPVWTLAMSTQLWRRPVVPAM